MRLPPIYKISFLKSPTSNCEYHALLHYLFKTTSKLGGATKELPYTYVCGSKVGGATKEERCRCALTKVVRYKELEFRQDVPRKEMKFTKNIITKVVVVFSLFIYLLFFFLQNFTLLNSF